jgi:hypothetical protein
MRACMRAYVRVQTFIYTSSRCWKYAFKASFTSPWCSCSASATPVAYRAAGQAPQAGARGRGGARDLQELRSRLSVEACPCPVHECDLLELILRGLMSAARRRLLRRDVCCEDRQRLLGLFLVRGRRLNNERPRRRHPTRLCVCVCVCVRVCAYLCARVFGGYSEYSHPPTTADAARPSRSGPIAREL